MAPVRSRRFVNTPRGWLMRNAMYRDKDGRLVRVQRTGSGYLLRYPDGSISTIGLNEMVSVSRTDQSVSLPKST